MSDAISVGATTEKQVLASGIACAVFAVVVVLLLCAASADIATTNTRRRAVAIATAMGHADVAKAIKEVR